MSANRTSPTKSPFVIAIDLCFQLARDHRVVPSEFAREHGIERDTVTKYLNALLSRYRLPLERGRDDEGHAEWSLAHPAFPGGAYLKADEARRVLSLIARLPKAVDRDSVMWLLHRALDPERVRIGRPSASDAMDEGRAHREKMQRLLFDAYDQRKVLRAHYHSTRDGLTRDRDISVHNIVVERVTRFVGSERGGERLRWFRLTNVKTAAIVDSVAFEPQDEVDVQRFISESYDGFHDGKPPRECVFEVRLPEARWVPQNLAVQPKVTGDGDPLVLTVSTSGVKGLARDVVGLGAAARAVTPELQKFVHELATGAIAVPTGGKYGGGENTARVRSRPARG